MQLYSEDKALTLLLTLTRPLTIYPADGLSCSFLLNLQRFFLNLIKTFSKLYILIQSLALFAIHHFCNYQMNDKIITFIYSVVEVVEVVASDKNPKNSQRNSAPVLRNNIWRLPPFDLNKKENWRMRSGKPTYDNSVVLLEIFNPKLSRRFKTR